MIYQLKRQIELPIDIEDAWEFFSAPANLRVITPPFLNMKITSKVPPAIYAGLIITYKVHPILSLPLTWVTEITQVREPFYFVDEQRHGPYKMWHHQHFLRETSSGTLVEDVVDYIMPFSILGCFAHSLFVQKQLREIFEYRSKVLKDLFGIEGDLQNEKLSEKTNNSGQRYESNSDNN